MIRVALLPKNQRRRNASFSILQAMDDPRLFARHFKDRRSWFAWRVFLSVLFGLPLDCDQLALFRQCTGRSEPDAQGYFEANLVIGRRGGKSFILALIAVYLATFRTWTQYLGPGERATIMIIAADRKQARVCLRYVKGLLAATPMIKPLIQNERAESVDLSNRVTVEVHSASFRSTRGYALGCILADEAAFWRSEESANPDTEILNALRPGMATVPGSLLLVASSPYARKGVLWDAYRKHFGKTSPVIVWRAATRVMNPSIPQGVIDQAMEADPASAAAEYLAEFRSDIENFVSWDVVQTCVTRGVIERAPQNRHSYAGFCDPSGGSSDSFTLAVAHKDADNLILDCLREIRPPFSPESVVEEFAGVLKSYGIKTLTGDRYAALWPVEAFARHGVKYVQSARTKSDLYQSFLPLLNSRRVSLLDMPRLTSQLVGLERRTARGGRDSIDHATGSHDDLANAAAGALTSLAVPKPKLRMGTYGYGGHVVEIDVSTGRPVGHEAARIKWVRVKESDVAAARGP